MTEPTAEVTAAMVLQVTNIRHDRAERIAAYATLRIGGLLPADARRETEISSHTAGTYERLLPVLCRRFDLPEPRKSRPDYRTPQDGRGGHARWHAARGVTDPGCPHCQNGGAS